MINCSVHAHSFVRRLTLLLAVALLFSVACRASDPLVVRYRYGCSDIDLRLSGNRVAIDTLLRRLDEAAGNPGGVSLRIDAYSSPEGSAVANIRLSEKRARRLLEYIRSRRAVPDSIMSVSFHGVDWEGLDSLVSVSDIPYKEEALAVIRDTPDRRLFRLSRLRGGKPYRYMAYNMFPMLRRSCITVTFIEERVAPKAGESLPENGLSEDPPDVSEIGTVPAGETTPQTPEDPVEANVPLCREETLFRPLLAVKTNLLEWAGVMSDFRRYTFVPNLELEYYFCDLWSLSVSGSYVRRGYGDSYFAVSSWSLEPRWWIWGDSRFRLVRLGVYGNAGDYDVSNRRLGELGATGRFWSAGLSLGATIPFTTRLGVDVGLRYGYRHSSVRRYAHEADADYLDHAGMRNRWGVTGINLSLYWRLGKTVKRVRP